MDDIFKVTKDANGQPIYTHNNEVLPKDVFDQRSAQSTAQQKEMMKPDAFDSQFDDMRAKTLAMKRPLKKAKGGSTNLKSSKISTHQKNPKHSNW